MPPEHSQFVLAGREAFEVMGGADRIATGRTPMQSVGVGRRHTATALAFAHAKRAQECATPRQA